MEDGRGKKEKGRWKREEYDVLWMMEEVRKCYITHGLFLYTLKI